MNNLSADIEDLKKRYREIFLKTSQDFSQKLEEIPSENLFSFLDEEALNEAYKRQLKVLENRKNYACSGCASCCKLACSEFSPQELEQKAQNGDNFANQFISVFVPYEKEEDARKIYPEYFELLKKEKADVGVYFYHCPKVTVDNRCPDYDNRPQICKDFPDNPIGFLPKACGYKKWKEDSEQEALEVHALLEIIDFYKEKIKEI